MPTKGRRFSVAAYIPVPRDLTRVKTKVFFNLTKRQLICFGSAALIGVPIFFLVKGTGNVSLAALTMMIVMLPLFFLAMYEKDGQPLEVIAGHFIQAKFIRPKVRPYQTNNYYDALVRQYQLEKEVERIVFQEETAGKGNKNACKSESKAAERN
nr:PrgI family protein [Enterocloster clostridioformis]